MVVAKKPGNQTGQHNGPGLRLVDPDGQADHRRLAQEIHESTDPLLDDIDSQLRRLHDLGHPGSEAIITECRATIDEIRSLMSALSVDESVPSGS